VTRRSESGANTGDKLIQELGEARSLSWFCGLWGNRAARKAIGRLKVNY
jgi:hypothetical protein